MTQGLKVVSDINGNNTLIDGTKPYIGMYTVASGTVNHINSVDSSGYGVVYSEGDVVLFKPSGSVALDSIFIVSGKTILHSSSPKRYKVKFNIITKTGSRPSTVDYVVLRASDQLNSSETYGLMTQDSVNGYTVVTFDSRAFTTADEIHIDKVWTRRFTHTENFGTVNNNEYYNTTSLEWFSATGGVQMNGIAYSNRSSIFTDSGYFPNQISKGISHYGRLQAYSNYYYRDSDYTVRGKKILGN